MRRTIATAVGVIAVVGLTGAAAGWLVAPQQSAVTFGVPLPAGDRLIYARVKGVQDLLVALLVAALLLTRRRAAAGIALLVGLLVPVTGALLVALTVGPAAVPDMPIHLGYAIVMAVAGVLLVREGDATGRVTA